MVILKLILRIMVIITMMSFCHAGSTYKNCRIKIKIIIITIVAVISCTTVTGVNHSVYNTVLIIYSVIILLSAICMCVVTDLYSRLGEVNVSCQLLPEQHVGIVRLFEHLLQLVQLELGERGAASLESPVRVREGERAVSAGEGVLLSAGVR